jgi:hypothetical protein
VCVFLPSSSPLTFSHSTFPDAATRALTAGAGAGAGATSALTGGLTALTGGLSALTGAGVVGTDIGPDDWSGCVDQPHAHHSKHCEYCYCEFCVCVCAFVSLSLSLYLSLSFLSHIPRACLTPAR